MFVHHNAPLLNAQSLNPGPNPTSPPPYKKKMLIHFF